MNKKRWDSLRLESGQLNFLPLLQRMTWRQVAMRPFKQWQMQFIAMNVDERR